MKGKITMIEDDGFEYKEIEYSVYLNALYKLAESTYDDGYSGYLANKADKELIEDLISKEKPMKPYYPPNYPTCDCPRCHYNIGDNKRCRNCGQLIDWSEFD